MLKRPFTVVLTVLAISASIGAAPALAQAPGDKASSAKPAAAKPAGAKPAATPATSAAAKPAGGMQAPKPAPELSQLKYFSGSWSCSGKFFGNDMMGPAHATKASVKISQELDGFWYGGRYQEAKTKENEHPYESDFVWGYDAAAKNFTAMGHDNMGGAGPQTSSGWDGDKLVFTGDMMMNGQKMGARDTFTKKGDGELMHLGEMQMNGQWTKLDEETCTKAGKAASSDHEPASKK